MRNLNKRTKLVESERRFKRACEQIVQLNYSLDALQKRYNRAKTDNNKSFRYSLRLRIAVVDGMRNMYYDYAHQKAESVAELRQELFGEVVDIISEDSSADIEIEGYPFRDFYSILITILRKGGLDFCICICGLLDELSLNIQHRRLIIHRVEENLSNIIETEESRSCKSDVHVVNPLVDVQLHGF
ncbi:unnamed protein product [Mytilus edulis]|uniref:Uncharacterized protein n=1 Tax=Mytilus edulis TaxID=6550 RepID=A0A8S3UE68_MYTED|nr:unnamed protein product [Mytilus edulis]